MCTGYLRSSASASRVTSVVNSGVQTEMYLMNLFINQNGARARKIFYTFILTSGMLA